MNDPFLNMQWCESHTLIAEHIDALPWKADCLMANGLGTTFLECSAQTEVCRDYLIFAGSVCLTTQESRNVIGFRAISLQIGRAHV
jgi:hypothetical protein